MAVKTILKGYIIKILCSILLICFISYPFLLIAAIKIDDSKPTVIVAVYTLVVYCILFFLIIVFNAKLGREIFTCVKENLYFYLFTIRGKALGKKELKIIKNEKEKIYLMIRMQATRGSCYGVCFEMCKLLEKGHIEILAVREYPKENKYVNIFTMHVIWVNNDWAFDTYSTCQYPVEKLYKIYKAKIYKKFSFEDIKDKSYSDFINQEKQGMVAWAIDNDCYTHWMYEDYNC